MEKIDVLEVKMALWAILSAVAVSPWSGIPAAIIAACYAIAMMYNCFKNEEVVDQPEVKCIMPVGGPQ